jgi:hypothetical protein
MKKMMEHLINVIQKEDLEIMFGKGSDVKISSINYSTNKKQFIIHSTLNATYNNTIKEIVVDNISESLDFYPTGLNMLIQESWKYFGIETEITIINKLDIV